MRLVLPLAMSLPVGLALRSLEPPAATSRATHQAPSAAGIWPALFGGLRSLVAGGCWLRANLAWEQRDEAATLAWVELAAAADDRTDYFRLNGARMIAYDLPTWAHRADPRREETCARRALRFLEQGLDRHGKSPALLIEMANVHLRRRGDLEQAARYYRLAAEQPGAPYYAARIHAELLLALGRPDEALAWLRRVLPQLPPDDPAARRAVVEARIRALEAAGGR